MAEQNHKNISFNPLFMFGLKSVLSMKAPELFSTQELAQLAEIESSFFPEEIVNNNNKYHLSDDQGSVSNEESNAIVQLPPPPPPLPLPLPLPPMPELPPHIRNRITDLNGTNAMYVMCKRLFKTDLNICNNRLSMPFNDIKYDFLTEIEKAILDTKEGKKLVGLEVVVLDPYFREFDMLLKKWNMSTCVYNLMRNWKLLLKQNNWDEHNKLDHRLHIWSFRINDKLHFVLDNQDLEDHEEV